MSQSRYVRRRRNTGHCPLCHVGLEKADRVCARQGCTAGYHEDCWRVLRAEYGSCAVLGCGSQEAVATCSAGLLLAGRVRSVLAVEWPRALSFQARFSESLRFSLLWGFVVYASVVGGFVFASTQSDSLELCIALYFVGWVASFGLLRVPLLARLGLGIFTRLLGWHGAQRAVQAPIGLELGEDGLSEGVLGGSPIGESSPGRIPTEKVV